MSEAVAGFATVEAHEHAQNAWVGDVRATIASIGGSDCLLEREPTRSEIHRTHSFLATAATQCEARDNVSSDIAEFVANNGRLLVDAEAFRRPVQSRPAFRLIEACVTKYRGRWYATAVLAVVFNA